MVRRTTNIFQSWDKYVDNSHESRWFGSITIYNHIVYLVDNHFLLVAPNTYRELRKVFMNFW